MKKTIMQQFMSIAGDLGFAEDYNPINGGNALPEDGVATYGWMKRELRHFISAANEEGEPLWEEVFGEDRIQTTRNAYNRAKRMLAKFKAIPNDTKIM